MISNEESNKTARRRWGAWQRYYSSSNTNRWTNLLWMIKIRNKK